MTDPILPYPEPDGSATAGWSGTPSSRTRAIRRAMGEDETLQDYVLRCLGDAGRDGMTISEFRAATPDHHHGSLSGALSVMAKAGRIAMLKDTYRGSCIVHVAPEHLDGRAVYAGRQKAGGEGAVSMDYAAGRADAEAEAAHLVEAAFEDGWAAGFEECRRRAASLVAGLPDTGGAAV